MQDILCNFSGARTSNLVVAKIKLRNGFVQHQTFVQDCDQIIIDKVSGQSQVSQLRSVFYAFTEKLGFRHLHAEELALILHVYVLCSKCNCQVR